jgi:hypothetical protein
MKKQALTIIGAGLLAVTAAFGASPTFTKLSSKISSMQSYKGDLFVYGTETGVAPNAPVSYSFNGTATATCDGVRTSITGTLLSATLDASSRGTVTQSVAIEAPCENPGNPTYSLQICDNTNGVCATVQ